MGEISRRKFLLVAGAATSTVLAAGLRNVWAAGKIKPTDSDALLVIDVQNCFVPGNQELPGEYE